ncbi:SMU1112c/YaeR family gloxylase I-like metalloprotein [Pseudoalteromonas viridis]|uniref:VOC family protein n=1 Tax=Pseudoalteromonas viridis TaxID=339617 RepID=A0ABX7V829_9GAMM|nr:VOC family protein [Pseudoalteromonas viridis]QTL35912.1 VOC family protein [Pseudoalteromonas viridis]
MLANYITRVHHVAIICSDYARAKAFYIDVIGCSVIAEHYQSGRQSYKLDLMLPDGTQIELFHFAAAPARPSYPEAQGLRHLALSVTDIEAARNALIAKGVSCEPIRIDPYTQKRFCFFADPDDLPLELYEA